MAKLVSSIVRGQIALINPLLERMDVKASRKLQDALGILGAKALAGSVEYRDEAFDNFEASWAEPLKPAQRGAILYLHGGSYTAGGLAYAKLFGGVLAEKTGYRTLCVGYRLAPEDPYPAALDDALMAYERIREHCEARDITFVGESAGGGLCYCLCLKLKELGLPQPVRVVALSPWTDLEMAGDYDEAAANDPVLNACNLRQSARMYGADRLTSPFVSPLFGDLTGLPPSLIMAGTDEILLGDSVKMAERLRECGCQCELSVARDMWHVYVLYGIPEAREALERIKGFILNSEDCDVSRSEKGYPRVDKAGQRGEYLSAEQNARMDSDVSPLGDA